MMSVHGEELRRRNLTFKERGRLRVKMYQCDEDYCEKLYDFHHRKREHMMKTHGDGAVITCQVCGKTHRSRTDLSKHMETSHPEIVKQEEEICPECGETLKNRYKFIYHMLYKHKKDMSTKVSKYLCKVCNFESRHLNSLKEHNRIHTGEKPEVCTFCGKSFRAKKTLRNHELLHDNIKPHACQHCEQRFVQKTSLTSHIKVHHKDKNI